MSPGFIKKAVILGLLSATGPFAIDMYLPALPSIAGDLRTSTAATQATLMAYFISFGLCQLVFGPISDMVGRKPPLYFGITLFIAASIGCALAPSIEWLIAFRVLQGIGASPIMVIPRAIIRDMHTGIEATRLMSLVMLVFSVCPILAPLVGSALIVPFGWRAVFVAVSVIALCSFALLQGFPETRPAHERVKISAANLIAGFLSLLRHGRFMGLAMIGGLGLGSFFVFLGNSSFVYITHYGLTPTQYSLAFSVNAIGFIGMSQLTAWLGQRFGINRLVLTAVTLYMVFALILFAVTLAGVNNLATLMVLLFMSFAFLGLVIPTTMVLALEEHGRIAGLASALAGTMQMVLGGLLIVLVSQFFDGTAFPMVTAIALCSTLAFVLCLLTLGRRQRAPAAQLAE